MKTLIIFLNTLFVVANTHAQQKLPLSYHPHHLTTVIAHRGSHVGVPENTLAAYQEAIKWGVDYVEVDLRTTKDSHFVAMHDATVDRMTNGHGAVNDLTYRELKNLKIHPASKSDKKQYYIPDFESILQVCKGNINIYLDFKEGSVVKAVEMIKKAGMENHVAVYVNKETQLVQWEKIAPEIPIIASLPPTLNLNQLDSLLQERKVNIVDNIYNKDKIKFLHSKGIITWLDVQSEEECPGLWSWVLKKGADGLQTDHPLRLISYLKEKAIR